jgi:hypothetical protein
LSYASPFEETAPVQLAAGGEVGVQKMAFGGIPYKPSALIPSRVKNQVATAQSALDAYNRDVGSYNDRLNEYNTRAEEYRRQVEDYNNQINAYNAQRNQYISSYIGGENPTLFTEFKGSYNPIAGSGAKPIPIKTPDLNPVFQGRAGPNPQYFIRHGEYRRMDEPSAPGSFSATEPSAPNAPTQPTQTIEQAQAAVAAAKDKQRRLQLTYDVMQDPEKFNLSMPALFSEGGEALPELGSSASRDMQDYLNSFVSGNKDVLQGMVGGQVAEGLDTRLIGTYMQSLPPKFAQQFLLNLELAKKAGINLNKEGVANIYANIANGDTNYQIGYSPAQKSVNLSRMDGNSGIGLNIGKDSVGLNYASRFSEGGVATQTAVPDSAAADYEKFMQSMKGVRNREDITPAQNMQMIETRKKILDPFTQEALRQYKLYHGPMIPKPITSKSPTTLFAGAPGAKVLELADLEDSNMSGFVIHPSSVKGKRTEDIIFVAPPMSQGANKIMQNRAPERFVENENPEKAAHLLLAHEAEHLLKRRADRDINETFDQLTKQARGENFLGSLFKTSPYLLRSRFVKDAANSTGYLKDKFKLTLPVYFDPKHVDSSMFHEQVATLAGLEETFGVDLTQDPVLRKTLFNDPDVRRAYRAVTGLRQTRLDAKDLAPYTLTPDFPYYPDASKIRNRTPTPVKRNAGSPVYGEIADTGGFTPDTRAALTNYQIPNAREMFSALNRIGSEANANAESVIRGSASATLGAAGDIGQEFDIRGLRSLPSSKQLRAMFPQRITQPTKEDEGFTNIGEFVPFVSPSFVKNTAQTMMNAFKKAAPTDPITGPTSDQLRQLVRSIYEGNRSRSPASNVVQAAPQAVKAVEAVAPVARSADQLFVGRIDEFLASQKNPVTKEQLIGQLKGKFRDYEIARVEEALADLPAASKLQPADLLARVKSKYPVENFRTSIIEPKPGVVFSNVDNVYGGNIGVINLTLPVTDAARKVSDEAMLTLNSLNNFGKGRFDPLQIDQITKYLNENGLSSNYKELLNSFKVVGNSPEIKKLTSAKETLLDVGRAVMYPALHPKEAEIFSKLRRQYPKKSMGELLPLRDMEMARIGLNQLTDLVSDPQFKALQPIANALKRGIDSGQEVRTSDIIGKINTEVALIDQQFKPVVDSIVSGTAKDEYTKLGKELQKKKIYEGQHGSITTKENPVAFSRFVDKEAVIPGMGKTKVMHITELQSDLFDDIIKKGPKSGSKEKDLAEVVNLDKKAFQIENSGPFQKEAVAKLKSVFYKLYPTSAEKSEAYKEILDRYPDIKPQLIEYIKISDRSEKLNARASIGNYGMDEAFAGMEKSPQVLQQLMIKNSIGAAMQRGVNAITFPGKESNQSQLYQKLGPNLKQVVKDLGKGFEIRPIELYDDFGNAYMHEGLVWDKDTAARVLKEGIKFNKGGAVDKNNLDYAKYI